MGLVSLPRLQSRHREAIGGSLLLCWEGRGRCVPEHSEVAAAEGGRGEQTVGVGVSWFSSMWSLSPPTLVSSVCTHTCAHTHTHTHTHGSGLCGRHLLQSLFPVCAHAHTHTHSSGLCGQHPHQPLFPVCAHACMHKHTHATFQVSVPIVLSLEERACPEPWLWPDLLGREWLAPVQGLPQRLDAHKFEATGCQPWAEALYIPLVSLVLTVQLIKLAVAESRHCSLLIS